MAELPLPLLNNLTFSLSPVSEKIEFETSSKFEYVATAIRNKPRVSINVSGYIPKQYFKILDDWLNDWDYQPFTWQGYTWVVTSYESEYLTNGLSGNINLSLVALRN